MELAGKNSARIASNACVPHSAHLRFLPIELNGARADFVFGITRVHNPDGSILFVGDKSESEIRSGVVKSSILVPNGAILLRRSLFERVGWFDSNIILRRSCDWDLFKRIITAGCSFEPIDKVLMDEYGGLQNN
jgi:hypothetical protein